jgi:hypothetical protein
MKYSTGLVFLLSFLSTYIFADEQVLQPVKLVTSAPSGKYVEVELNAIKFSAPLYPPDMARDDVEGWAKFKFKLSSNGKPVDILTIDGVNHLTFKQRVTGLISRWQFKIPPDYSKDNWYIYKVEFYFK